MARKFSKELKKRKAYQKRKSLILKSKEIKSTKLAKKIQDAKKYVRNFSSHPLILSKGVKFIPTPKSEKCNIALMRDFSNFERRMRCTYLFTKEDNKQMHPFYIKTGYSPAYSCEALENYLFATRYEISKIKPEKQICNISRSEWNALRNLRSNDDIVIKKADKNSTICVIDKQIYNAEGLRQLENDTYYEKIQHSNVNEFTNAAVDIIENAFKSKQIDEMSYNYICQDLDSRKLGHFFMLPKIHKIPIDILKEMEVDYELRKNYLITGRPIVSLCGTPLHNVGRFIDHILLPMVQNQCTYTRDTKHFIRKIESIKVPQDTFLITCDASNMYTNLEINEILEAVNRLLDQVDINNYSIKIPRKETILELLNIILRNNEFTFNDQIYKQKIGVPMGGSVSAELADIRMYEIFENILNKYEHKSKIIFCARYRDDIFLLHKGSEAEIHEFFQLANSCHKLLKFTYDISYSEMPFLDTFIYKGERFNLNGTLDLKTYTKKTDTFQYLERGSSHPQGVFKGFIKGEIIRHIRNTSDAMQLQNIIKVFKIRLIQRGYKSTEIDEIIQNTIHLNRKDLLQDNRRGNDKTIVLVTKFNPAIKKLKKILLKHWQVLQSNKRCKQIFNRLPMIAYKRGKNLQDLLKK